MKKNRNLIGSGFLKLVPVWLRTMKLLPLVLIVGLMQLSLIAFSQQQGQRTISGRITDTKGEALPGVTVLLQGTTNGTLTNADGKYSLPGVPDKGVLVFTFVGMTPQQIDIQNKATIDVVMEVETIALDELVVVGYGVQKRVTLTGSTAIIKNADLVASPTPTASQAIAGKIPGVMTRMPDGRPGNSSALQIRNMGTPLYVIDGNQSTEAGFNSLDMNDIEDISILKDASAAIYGMQAANGVVLVTTKKGKIGEKTKINLNTYYGWQNWTRFARASDAGTFVFANASADVNGTMAASGTGTTSWTQRQLDHWRLQDTAGFIGTDWYDFAVVKNAPQQYINVNATGGSEGTTYYLSLSKLNQDASFRQYNFNRINLQSNIDSKVGKRITIGARISAQIGNTNEPAAPGDPMWNALYGLYRNYPTWQVYANNNPKYINHTGWDESQEAEFRKDIIGYYEQINRSLNTTLYAEYQTPLKGLTARFQYVFGVNQGNFDRFQYTYNTYTYDPILDVYNVTGGITTGSHTKNSTLSFSNTYQGQLNYTGQFGDHGLTVTYVFEARDNVTPNNLSVDSKPSSNALKLIQYAELTGFSNTWSSSATIGHVGRINYNYKSKYLVEISGRLDGTYFFPPNHRYGLFPAAAVGWRVSEEPFYKNSGLSSFLDNLKLRTSYGMMGNSSPGSYSAFDYLNGYNYNSGSQVFNSALVVGSVLRSPAITGLSWAKAYSFDVGLDWSIKKGMLSGEVDFFRRDMTGLSATRSDLLMPDELNITIPPENLNAQMARGWDGIVRHNGRVRGVDYGLSVNLGYSRTKVTKVYKPRYGNSWDKYRNGTLDRNTGQTWLYQCIGQFQSMEQINNYPVNIDGQGNRTLLPGDLIYKDFNNDGIINTMDMRPLGWGQATSDPWGYGVSRTGLPNLSYGVTANVSWKGFDLSVSGQGATMATFIIQWELRNPLQGNANSSTRVLTNSWHLQDIYFASNNPGTFGDESWVAAKYPPIRYNAQNNSSWSRESTYWAKNVTYLRLRNLDFGYTIPKKFLTKLGIQNCRIYTNGYNLLSLDNLRKYSVDPEVSTTSGLQYPQSKIINVGANITF